MTENHGEPRTLLAGGMIFDGSGQPLFPGDVLIAGNRIEAVVAATESWDPPEDAVRIELTGRTVMPGLVEGHAHISFTGCADLMDLALMPVEENLIAAICNAALLLDHGFTSLVSAAASKPRLDVAVRNAIEAGQIVGPRMLAASQEITPTGNLGDLDQAHFPIPESARVRVHLRRARRVPPCCPSIRTRRRRHLQGECLRRPRLGTHGRRRERDIDRRRRTCGSRQRRPRPWTACRRPRHQCRLGQDVRPPRGRHHLSRGLGRCRGARHDRVGEGQRLRRPGRRLSLRLPPRG